MRKRSIRVLVLKPDCAEAVVSGRKTWELRSFPAEMRGRVRIAASKPVRKLVGEVDIVDCHKVSEQRLLENHDKHLVLDLLGMGVRYAWVLEGAAKYAEPRPYTKKAGAVNIVAMYSAAGSGKKTYACDFEGCGCTTGAKRYLTERKRKHTGEKPFICDACSEAFAKESVLKRHKRTHDIVKPHKCNILGCNKSFTQKWNLQRHLMDHGSEKPFRCDFPACGYASKRAADVRRHQKRCHSA